jgi:hypothetical protein
MNPHNLSASDLMIWGLVAHLVADWPLQNDWMAKNKMKVLHPAGYVHAAIHAFFLSLVFGWAGFFIAFAHLLIDFRKPVQWWSKFIRQTQPKNQVYYQRWCINQIEEIPVYDIGLEVRFWTDQVFHIICIAIAALLITWPS